ncbi:hypothetical protein JQN72_08520 [Phycicoccus sp. CSK15P-2]|uniref:hypothetical protein n=1 Tax=Phycicoccus sp. CSK15P-2 TaxID=2807627 RepID=UPI00194FCC77|nr:hypothetical protein [Phycicoccus sp. CSK15P-2]MBM6404285.1 hypothetical protein [Phycicoccus sp. CSK15P-2]
MISTLLALLFGAASAVVPFLNSELYAAAAARSQSTGSVLAVVAALAVGQTAGKLVLFEAARRGSERFARKRAAPRWAERLASWMTRRRTAVPLVLVSAGVGLPPLAGTTLAAGAAGQRRKEFALLCLLGRTARFLALATSVGWVLS